MKSYKKAIYLNLALAIILTIFLPAGIVGIIMGATRGITPLLIAGIVMTVLGFYGAPISWISYGDKKKAAQILNLIQNENVYSADVLAEQIACKRQEVIGKVNSLISKSYLTGYLLKDGELVANTNQKRISTKNKSLKCDNCGARMKETQDAYVCDYCGNKIKK